MNRLPLHWLFALLAVAVIASAPFRHAQAANDLDKWNSDTGRVIRSTLKEKVATTTYREMPNVVDAEYRSTSNGGKVLHRIEHATTQSGSKVGTTIEALKQVDKAAVAKKWANQIFKGGVRFTAGAVLIEVAMQEMLDGLDWIMTEGGEIKRPPSQAEMDAYHNQYGYYTSPYYYNRGSGTGDFYSLDALFKNTTWATGLTYSSYSEKSRKDGIVTVIATFSKKEGGTQVSEMPLFYYQNRNYNPSKAPAPPSEAPVPKAQAQQQINNYLNTSPNSSKDLLIEEAYKPTGKGYIQWSDDPDSRVEIFGDTPDIAKRVYDSDNPVGDGLTKSTPQIKDSTVIEGETTPNPNPEPPTIPDPVTGQPIPNPNYDPNQDSGSTTTTKLPPACEYFAKLCEWIDWTQEPPDLQENSEVEIKDQDLINYQYSDHIKFIASCPFSPRMEIFPMGILGNMNVEVDFSYFCNIATMMKAVVIALSAFIAVLMLAYAAKDI